jgi:hypothetical protein
MTLWVNFCRAITERAAALPHKAAAPAVRRRGSYGSETAAMVTGRRDSYALKSRHDPAHAVIRRGYLAREIRTGSERPRLADG